MKPWLYAHQTFSASGIGRGYFSSVWNEAERRPDFQGTGYPFGVVAKGGGTGDGSAWFPTSRTPNSMCRIYPNTVSLICALLEE